MQQLFLDSISRPIPEPARPEDVKTAWSSLFSLKQAQLEPSVQAKLNSIAEHPVGKKMLECVFGNSPYLTQIIIKYPHILSDICESTPEAYSASILNAVNTQKPAQVESLMELLRDAKRKFALVTALSDITGYWKVEQVTASLSQFADQCLQKSAEWLLNNAAKRSEITLHHPADPCKGSGWVILGLGKLGAKELNYSSDVDLILLFDKDKIQYIGEESVQKFMNKLTHELVRIMQELTPQGYVFRTDIRLRPDPASTPPCMSMNGALTYYETVGQNWERAALIKARPVAGDIQAGYDFIKWITPFIWRKYLDFAAITDIQSIKRQMDAHHQAELEIRGHNIKIGIGGIREIEFYAQIHQLIWGGRMPQLRSSSTTATLKQLAKEGLISEEHCKQFVLAYWYFRTVEHRLQMIADQQTHSIPENMEDIHRVAIFLGYQDAESFTKDLIERCLQVHQVYIHSFKGQGALGTEGKLVFTGVEPDPGTLETLSKMGFVNTTTVFELIAGWHRGSRRATRTKRARELITEVTPHLLKALSTTAAPDQAFIKFDEFLNKLPAVVQLFSLFNNNPALLELIATIMGSAPAMADALARQPNLLDAVISGQFYEELPDRSLLLMEFSNYIFLADNFEEEVALLRRFKNEKQFQAGVQLLTGRITDRQAAIFLSDLADMILQRVLKTTEREFVKSYGNLAENSLAVIALGKLGARELTFGSDLDLIFVYNPPDETVRSDGEKSFNSNVYYSRLCQRFIGALTALSREGRLYEIDMRLRPSGNQGPIAVSMEGFNKYFLESAWTFERMALCKARVLTGDPEFQKQLLTYIHTHIQHTNRHNEVKQDIIAMRSRVQQEFATDNPWDIKYARGGLMDLDFIAQYMVLTHANRYPEIMQASTQAVFSMARTFNLLDAQTSNTLSDAYTLLSHLFFILRLCNNGTLNVKDAPSGLKNLLCKLTQQPSFEALQTKLVSLENLIDHLFSKILV